MEDLSIQDEPLSHKTISLNGVLPSGITLFCSAHGQGIDLGTVELCYTFCVLFPGRSIAHERIQRKVHSVGLLDDRHVLIVDDIVAGSGQEGSNFINAVPFFVILFRRKRDIHEQRTAVRPFVFLGEIDPSIPHHGPEITLEFCIARIIASGNVLGIILTNLIFRHHKAFLHSGCLHHLIHFHQDHGIDLGGNFHFEPQKFCSNTEIDYI